MPGLGDPVRHGKFELVVTKLDCGKSKVGSDYLNKKAQLTTVELHDSPFSGGVEVRLS